MENNNKTTYAIVRTDISLTTIGIITGIVLSVLQGVGVINIGWFWATFPFWIVPAASLALFLILMIIAIICGCIISGRDD